MVIFGERHRLKADIADRLGVIGGEPTFLGTAVGQQFTSDPVSVVFLTLTAGSILYVIVQRLGVAERAGHKELM